MQHDRHFVGKTILCNPYIIVLDEMTRNTDDYRF